MQAADVCARLSAAGVVVVNLADGRGDGSLRHHAGERRSGSEDRPGGSPGPQCPARRGRSRPTHYCPCLMRGTGRRTRVWLSLTAVVLVPAMLGFSAPADAHTSCAQIGTVYGIPPWGYHTGSYSGESWFAKGHGNINFEADTVSGVMCQQDPRGTVLMSVLHHLVYHSHYAMRWGYPGNLMKIRFRVTSSTEPKCTVGTVGRATIYGSYNGVRSDSVQFFFPAACKGQDHLYHGSRVNVQVPPPCVAPRPACVSSLRVGDTGLELAPGARVGPNSPTPLGFSALGSARVRSNCYQDRYQARAIRGSLNRCGWRDSKTSRRQLHGRFERHRMAGRQTGASVAEMVFGEHRTGGQRSESACEVWLRGQRARSATEIRYRTWGRKRFVASNPG
jgi:hypothetical protein